MTIAIVDGAMLAPMANVRVPIAAPTMTGWTDRHASARFQSCRSDRRRGDPAVRRLRLGARLRQRSALDRQLGRRDLRDTLRLSYRQRLRPPVHQFAADR